MGKKCVADGRWYKFGEICLAMVMAWLYYYSWKIMCIYHDYAKSAKKDEANSSKCTKNLFRV